MPLITCLFYRSCVKMQTIVPEQSLFHPQTLKKKTDIHFASSFMLSFAILCLLMHKLRPCIIREYYLKYFCHRICDIKVMHHIMFEILPHGHHRCPLLCCCWKNRVPCYGHSFEVHIGMICILIKTLVSIQKVLCNKNHYFCA